MHALQLVNLDYQAQLVISQDLSQGWPHQISGAWCMGAVYSGLLKNDVWKILTQTYFHVLMKIDDMAS